MVNFALVLKILIWLQLAFILFKVGFDLKLLSMCMYAYLL